MTQDITPSLRELYRNHEGKVTIKWDHYLDEYDRIFAGFRKSPVRLLEVGVLNGGSLEIWAKYFENGVKFVGCDIDARCAKLGYEDRRISIVLGDVTDDSVSDEIKHQVNSFDIIIDDGSHGAGDIVKSFLSYFPHLTDGGIYVIEDMHTSYWQEYGGGLYHPYSAMTFFKRMADIIHHEFWMAGKTLHQYLLNTLRHFGVEPDVEMLRDIHAVEFMNSMCLVRKATAGRKEPVSILVAGRYEPVSPVQIGPSGRFVFPDQSQNPWSNMALAPDEAYTADLPELRDVKVALENCRRSLDTQSGEISALLAMIRDMQTSQSWRWTAPLRRLKAALLKS